MKEYQSVRLGDICSKIGSGSTPTGGSNIYCNDGTSLIRSQNVLDYDFSFEGLAHISDDIANSMGNVSVQSDDILLNITGDSVARACIVPDDVLPARVNQHVMIIRTNKNIIDPWYLFVYLESIKEKLLSISSSGATRNAITKNDIENLEIPLPIIDHQRKIRSIVKNICYAVNNNNQINDYLAA